MNCLTLEMQKPPGAEAQPQIPLNETEVLSNPQDDVGEWIWSSEHVHSMSGSWAFTQSS
jgi:hypothetical protein